MTAIHSSFRTPYASSLSRFSGEEGKSLGARFQKALQISAGDERRGLTVHDWVNHLESVIDFQVNCGNARGKRGVGATIASDPYISETKKDEMLTRLLSHPDKDVRLGIAQVAGSMIEPSFSDTFVKLARDPELEVREALEESARKIEDPERREAAQEGIALARKWF
jgi:hypothetical protein